MASGRTPRDVMPALRGPPVLRPRCAVLPLLKSSGRDIRARGPATTLAFQGIHQGVHQCAGLEGTALAKRAPTRPSPKRPPEE